MSLLDRQLRVMRDALSWEPSLRIMGGFAEDALLHGRATRPHEDIDLVVLREHLDMVMDRAEAQGFGHPWHLRIAMERSRPLVLGSVVDGVDLEIGVFERDEEGRVYWEKPTAEGAARLYFPEDAFEAPAVELEGVPVRTVSPLALYQIRVGLVDLFGGMRGKDVTAQRMLRERFFRGVPETELAPRIEAPTVATTAWARGPS